jgi:glutamate racemase
MVFSEMVKQMPNEDIIYLGDTGRFPYGTKSKETIIEYAKQSIEFLMSKNVKLIVIACGTATSQALEEVKKIYKIPIIGIIEPTVESINKSVKSIAVMATAGTIRSGAWEREIKKQFKNINIINRACPLLAPLAEEGFINNEIARLTVKEYVKGLEEADAIILGCTHYPLFKKIISEQIPKAEIIDTGERTSKYVKSIIKEWQQENENVMPKYKIYLTDTETSFMNIVNIIINDKNLLDKLNIEKVKINM